MRQDEPNDYMITLKSQFFWCWPKLVFSLLLFLPAGDVRAVENERSTNQVSKAAATKSLMAVLPPAKWQQVEKSDRGLTWIASQQAADGSFPTLPSGQPGSNESSHDGVLVARTSTGCRAVRSARQSGNRLCAFLPRVERFDYPSRRCMKTNSLRIRRFTTMLFPG